MKEEQKEYEERKYEERKLKEDLELKEHSKLKENLYLKETKERLKDKKERKCSGKNERKSNNSIIKCIPSKPDCAAILHQEENVSTPTQPSSIGNQPDGKKSKEGCLKFNTFTDFPAKKSLE